MDTNNIIELQRIKDTKDKSLAFRQKILMSMSYLQESRIKLIMDKRDTTKIDYILESMDLLYQQNLKLISLYEKTFAELVKSQKVNLISLL